MRVFVSILLASMMLSACSSTYREAQDAKERARQAIDRVPSHDDASAAVYTTQPAPDLVPIEPPEGPDWLYDSLTQPVRVASMPFDVVVDRVLSGTGVVPRYDHGMELSTPITLSHQGNIKGALEKLAARTNYGYEASDNTLSWRAFETKTFTLPITGGDYSFMIGKDDEQGGGSGGGSGTGIEQSLDTSDFNTDAAQFSNLRGEDLDVFGDVEKAVADVVGDYGRVVASRATSTIMVRTTPDRMRSVTGYINSVTEDMTTQVKLELKVIEVTSRKGSDRGVDWRAVKTNTDSVLEFVGESPSNQFTNSVPIAFSGTDTGGSSTVELLVQSLEEQADVSFLTEQSTLSRSGKLSELELFNIRGFLERSSVTNTTDIGSSQSLEPGVLQSGYTLYSLSKVFGDRVALAISNRSSDLEPLERVGTEDNFIQVPSLNGNRMHIHQIVRDGTTVVAGMIRREGASNQSNSPVSARWAPSYRGAEKTVTEIYMLVTPRIVRDI